MNCEKGRNENFAEKNLRKILQLKKLCDVVLIAGDDLKRISAHRVVLAASSDYFSAMFTGYLREAYEKEIKIENIQGDILESLVNFCYTGQIDILSVTTVENLLRASCHLQLKESISICSNFMIQNLDIANCLGVFFVADHLNCNLLKEKSWEYVTQNFNLVCQNSEVLELSLVQLKFLLASDELAIDSEEKIFECVMAWINYDFNSREKHFYELIGLVRLEEVDVKFFIKNILPVLEAQKSFELLIETMKSYFLNAKTVLSTRCTYKNKAILSIGINPQNCFTYIEIYSPEKNKWLEIKEEKNFLETDSLMAFMNNKIYFIASYVKCLDLSNMKIHNISKVVKPQRRSAAFVCYSEELYVIGGESSSRQVLNTVEKYNVVLDKWWTLKAQMFVYRKDASAAVLNGLLYVAGGSNTKILTSVECFDHKTDTWHLITPMNKPRTKFGIAAEKDFLYVVGGDGQDIATVERYDPKLKEWKIICYFNCGLENPGCTIFDNFLVILGNALGSSQESRKKVKFLNTETTKTKPKASLNNCGRFNCFTVSYNYEFKK